MKHTSVLHADLLFLVPAFSVLADSQPLNGCEAKRQNIEHQIEYARTYGDTFRIAGLNKALKELNANCSEQGLRAERESNIRKKEIKVEERRRELAEAQAEGRNEKIHKKQLKLEEAQDDLNEARNIITY